MLEAVASRLKLLRCTRLGRGVRVYGRVWVHGGGDIELGDGVVLDARVAPIELRASATGRLVLGPGCIVLGGTSLESERSVTLGANVRVGHYAKVIDTHFHSLTGDRTVRPPPGTVVIERDVVVEARAIVLPGAYVEAGARVAARAVISKRVPAGTVASGNPAKIARSA